MMGSKQRHFAPLINASLDELVPQDHFYRRLERTLDLSFVREFVQETYAGGGRPSVDPMVFWHRCNSSCSLRASARNGC
jgi:transposase